MGYFTSIAPTCSNKILNALLATIATRPATALVVDGTIKLYKSLSAPLSPSIVIAQITEVNFSGYEAVPLVFSSPTNNPSTLGKGIIAHGDFIMNDDTLTDTAAGYFVSDAGDNIVMIEPFPAPMVFQVIGDFCSLDAVLGLDFNPQIT